MARGAGLTLLRGMFLGLTLLSPFIVGAPYKLVSDLRTFALGTVLGFVFAALWWLSGTRSERAHKVVTAVVSGFLSLTLLDVVARPFVGPDPSYITEWPPMPLVTRYLRDVHISGKIYGELAVSPPMATYREYREMTFITDRFGFRNDRPVDTPLDVIAVGDSYTVAHNTTQEKMWSTLLSKQHGLHLYNMAVGGDGPWTEFTNLTIELDRLMVKPKGTVVLWMLFTGNDLLDPCYPLLSKEDLPWRNGLRGLVGRSVSKIMVFRKRSPLGRALDRIVNGYVDEVSPDDIIARKFLDGRDILFFRNYAGQATLSLDSVRLAPNFECIKRTLSAMRHFAERKNLIVAIIVAPPKEEVYSWLLLGRPPWSVRPTPSGFASAISDMAREEHMPFLDLMPFLAEASERVYRQSGKLVYWRDDTHWNEEGNAEVAKVLYELYKSVTTGAPSPRATQGSHLGR